jgi:competence protein ComEC
MPLLWLSLAFLTGILLGEALPWSWKIWLMLGAIPLVLGLAYRFIGRMTGFSPNLSRFLLDHLPSRFGRFVDTIFESIAAGLRFVLFWLILPALCLGAARYRFALPDLKDASFIAAYVDTGAEMVVQGFVAKPPDVRDEDTRLIISAEQIHPVGDVHLRSVHGLVLANVTNLSDWHYGDRVIIRGELETPPDNEDFSYRAYLASRDIYASMPDAQAFLMSTGPKEDSGNPILRVIYALRDRAHSMIYRLWPDPEASLLAGILLGIESGIPTSVQDAFRDTGTSHIIVISGFNITIVAGLFSMVFSRLLGRWRGAFVAGVGIAAYTLLVGAEAAVVRAAIMGGLSLFARQIGRRQDGLNSLAIVAAAMALFNPNVLRDVGFQLSFMATLGLVLYADPLSRAFTSLASRRLPLTAAQRLAGPVGEYVLFTLAAQVTTLPIMIYHFRRLSLSSLLANPLILPAQPPVMILGGLAVILGLIHFPIGQLAAYLAWPFVVYTIRAVELIAHLTSGVLEIEGAGLLSVALFYGALLGWTFGGAFVRRLISNFLSEEPSVSANIWINRLAWLSIGALGILSVVVWRMIFSAPDGRLHMTLLNTNDDTSLGDTILIQSPAGRYVLINGGPSASILSESLGRRLPLFHRQLDYLVVTASYKGQLAALPSVVKRFPPANVLWAGSAVAFPDARYLYTEINQSQIATTDATSGQILDLGNGANLHVLTSGKRGAIFSLEWKSFRALLPLGANFEELESLHWGQDIGRVTALILADNGLASANPPEWINNLRPQVILLSVAPKNRQGFPSPETLDTIAGYPLLRTDQNGWIHLSTDGDRLWVEVERR